MTSFVDCLMNANSATKPGMMPIKNLAKNGPVGVLKPRCTTTSERIDPWIRMRRSLAKIQRIGSIKSHAILGGLHHHHYARA
jgi:hypothetical protein